MRDSGIRQIGCRALSWAAIGLLSVVAGCDGNATGHHSSGSRFVEQGGLVEIESRGVLRILFPLPTDTGHLPRRGFALDFELGLAESYAESLELEPRVIYIESRDDLIPALLQGRGDLVAGNLTVTRQRKERVQFTVPVDTVREQLITRVGDPLAAFDGRDGLAGLAGRRIAIRGSSSYLETLSQLREQHPGFEIEEVPENLDTEEIIHRVAGGEYDLTVADSNLVDATLSYRDDVEVALDLTGDRAIAWAIRPESPELLQSLNRFLTDSQLTRRSEQLHVGDLDEIRKRRTLRVLSRNSAETYFLWRGNLKGFEYDLAKEFARSRGLRLEMVVPPADTDLVEWLLQGRGDIVAAALSPGEIGETPGIVFSRPYNYVQRMVVGRESERPISELYELAGRTFHVRRGSAYWSTLVQIRNSGIDLRLRPAPDELSTEEIIGRVADDDYDLTLADSHVLAIELTWRDDVRSLLEVGEQLPLAWVVRAANPELQHEVDAFLKSTYRSLFYNVKYEQYFEDAARYRDRVAPSSSGSGFSPYDELVQHYADRFGFDWRLIVAQMYQESRFDPRARSFAGARGLMQLLPRTAAEFGFDDLEDPESAIHAGVKYMDWVRDRFEPELPVSDRMLFTLAAYNAGTGHVRDARRLAARQGLNPNRWFGNVENAMLLLSRRQFYVGATHGYCRCGEPVNYVREIWSRYRAYLDALQASL